MELGAFMKNRRNRSFIKRIKKIGDSPWKLYKEKRYKDAMYLFGELAFLYQDVGDLEKACECFYLAAECAFLIKDYSFAEMEYCRSLDIGLKIKSKFVNEAIKGLKRLYTITERRDLIRKVQEIEDLDKPKGVIICSKCNAIMPKDAKFCGRCGAELLCNSS